MNTPDTSKPPVVDLLSLPDYAAAEEYNLRLAQAKLYPQRAVKVKFRLSDMTRAMIANSYSGWTGNWYLAT